MDLDYFNVEFSNILVTEGSAVVFYHFLSVQDKV